MFNKYPYTDIHELNLDWIISRMQELEEEISVFTSFNQVKFADPIQWQPLTFYPKNTIVADAEGNSYISKKDTPAGVPVGNGEYWQLIGNYSAQFREYVHKCDTAEFMVTMDLLPGDYVYTGGYHTVNDGGSALYKIVENEPLTYYERLLNENYAVLVVNDNLTPETLGCYGDGVHDDTAALQSYFNYCATNGITAVSNAGKDYKITSNITISSYLDIEFNNATISSNGSKIVLNGYQRYAAKNFIKGIVFNNTGIVLDGVYGTCISECSFRSMGITAVHFLSGVENVVDNVYIRGDGIHRFAGIIVDYNDNDVTNIILVDTNVGIEVNNNIYLANIHGWILTSTLLEGSALLHNRTGNALIFGEYLYNDTFQYFFKKDLSGWYELHLSNLFCNQNPSVYNLTKLRVIEARGQGFASILGGKIINNVRTTATDYIEYDTDINVLVLGVYGSDYKPITDSNPAISNTNGYTLQTKQIKKTLGNITVRVRTVIPAANLAANTEYELFTDNGDYLGYGDPGRSPSFQATIYQTFSEWLPVGVVPVRHAIHGVYCTFTAAQVTQLKNSVGNNVAVDLYIVK